MRYRAYSGPRGSDLISALDKQRMPFKEFETLDGALAWARFLEDSGRTPLLIEGDDGTSLAKQEIAAALRHSEALPHKAATAGSPAT
jgi:hypothetical protein